MTPEQHNHHDVTLVFINQARVALRMDPLPHMPKGLRCSCVFCPVARALGPELNAEQHVAVGKGIVVFDASGAAAAVAQAWTTNADRCAVALPADLERFRNAFDQGWLPEFNLDPLPAAVTE
jgi:hypothetical protein